MTNSPKDLLQRLLSTTGDEWLLAPQAVQVAFAWCALVASPSRLTDRVQALRSLLELNKALKQGVECFSLLPGLIELAIPGKTTQNELLQNKQVLEKNAESLAQLQADLEILSRQEEELRAQEAERENLQKRRAELERLIHLADSGGVEELRQQLEELEKRLPADAREVERLEEDIEKKAQNLIVLSEKRLNSLRESASKLLSIAESRDKELRDATEKLRAARERYDNVSHELAEQMEDLRRYEEADRVVAQALPNARNAHQILDDVKQRLNKVDEALKIAIKENKERTRLKPLSFGDG